MLGLSKTIDATPSTRRRFDGVVHHAFHLADMYLTQEAAAYICGLGDRARPVDLSDPREASGPRIARNPSSA